MWTYKASHNPAPLFFIFCNSPTLDKPRLPAKLTPCHHSRNRNMQTTFERLLQRFFFLLYFTLQYCIGFAIHWHESTTGVYKLPILNPPPTSHPISSLWIIPMHQPQASCIEHRLALRFLHDSIHVSMPFSRIIPPSPSPSESKSPFYTSVSLLLSRIQGHHYHLSNFRIYVSVYCIGVFISGLFHSV